MPDPTAPTPEWITLREIASIGTETANGLHGPMEIDLYPPPSFDLKAWMRERQIRPSKAAPLLGIRAVQVFDLMAGRAEPVEGWEVVRRLLAPAAQLEQEPADSVAALRSELAETRADLERARKELEAVRVVRGTVLVGEDLKFVQDVLCELNDAVLDPDQSKHPIVAWAQSINQAAATSTGVRSAPRRTAFDGMPNPFFGDETPGPIALVVEVVTDAPDDVAAVIGQLVANQIEADAVPVAEPRNSLGTPRSCNLHNDCDAAEALAAATGKKRPDHCHDECCEDCFGS